MDDPSGGQFDAGPCVGDGACHLHFSGHALLFGLVVCIVTCLPTTLSQYFVRYSFYEGIQAND